MVTDYGERLWLFMVLIFWAKLCQAQGTLSSLIDKMKKLVADDQGWNAGKHGGTGYRNSAVVDREHIVIGA